MRAARVLVLSMACLLAAAPVASGQQAALDVTISRGTVSTRLGDDFGFSTEIRNRGSQQRSDLVAQLNIAGLSSGIYVDPEDWSSERTKRLPTLAPGESTTVSWSVTAVTGGRAAIYVVVLPEDRAHGEPVSSPAIDVRIADTKDLNTDGVLPLALGIPAFLGLLTVAVRRRRNGVR